MTRILVLNTHLYPDQEGMEAALALGKEDATIKQIDLAPLQTEEAFWDWLVEELLAADKIISI